MEEGGTDTIRKQIETSIEEESRNNRFATLLEQLLRALKAASDPAEVDRILKYITNYLRVAPDVIDAATKAATEEGVLELARPVFNTAILCWTRTATITSPRVRIVELASKAYMTNYLIQKVDSLHKENVGQPLISVDLASRNLAVRRLFTPSTGQQLDAFVDNALRRSSMQQSITSLESWRGTLNLRSIGRPPEEPISSLLKRIGVLEGLGMPEDIARVTVSIQSRESFSEEPRVSDEPSYSYEVWYGTTRAQKDSKDPAKGFWPFRDESGIVHYGKCQVKIPKAHKFGSTGTSWLSRWPKLQFKDDHLRLTKIVPMGDGNAFFDNFRSELQNLHEPERVVLVYIHGFSVSFKDAAIRAAQMGFDLKIPGATAFFSWPSKGKTSRRAYEADAERIAGAEGELEDFLVDIATRTGANSVHVIAHSMGNRGLARAIEKIADRVAPKVAVRFGQIILAAPDIDVTLFRRLAVCYPMISTRTTMYVSSKDKALWISGWLQDSDRAGFTPPVTVVPKIDTVEVTKIDLTVLGHGYYAEAAPVLYDMHEIITRNAKPSERLRIMGVPDQKNPKYWVIEN